MPDTQKESAALTGEEAVTRCGLAAPHSVVKLAVRPDDFVALQRYVMRQQAWVAFAVWQATLVCLLGGAIFISLSFEDVDLKVVIILSGLVYLAGTLGYPIVRNSLDQMKLDRIRVEFAQTKDLPAAWFVLSPEGYALITQGHDEVWRWPQVREMVREGEHLILVNERRDAHFVAGHMFESPEKFAEFVSRLEGYWDKRRQSTELTQADRTPDAVATQEKEK
jgi:hypothetical protein